ncbi:hydroxyacid dehydrogenase [Candidatus Nomurabacteria bacterium]|nr:hydroxyacid dehydrogenase [Candidatus Nomurabacteria bacterium]
MAKKTYHCQFFLTLTPDLKKYIRGKLRGHKLTMSDQILSLDKLDKKTEVLGVFVDSKIDKKVFAALPKLKLVLTLSTGFDHIDMREAKRRGVVVCNVPTYGSNTVAEFAIALTLAVNRKLYHCFKRVKEGQYDYHGLRGSDLQGKTIGVLGTGKIGAKFIQMVRGFETEILAFDAFPNKQLAENFGFRYVPLSMLLKKSDILSLHLPLLDSTKHIINKKAIKKMKPGVIIINTARGGLIDSEALVWGLKQNIIGGAGLDVLEGEDLLEDTLKLLNVDCSSDETRLSLMNNMLIDHPNTIVSPHNAFNTHEAVRRIIDTSIDNFKAFHLGNIQNEVK